MRALIAALALAAAACGQSAAPGVDDTTLPPEVIAARDDHARFGCSRVEDAVYNEGYLSSGDLNADGKPDYVLDTHAFACTDSAGPFCGSAGCEVLAFVSAADGSYSEAMRIHFGNPVRFAEESGSAVLREEGADTALRWTGAALE